MLKYLFLFIAIAGMAQERLVDRVALITGGAQGIGKGIAQVFAREGAHVIITDVQDDAGEKVAQELGATYLHLNVASETDWEMAMQQILEKFSRLDILVNNAGISGYANPETCTLEEWRKTQSIDLEGVFLGCKYAIQTMKQTTAHGSIINISSILWMKGSPYGPAYSASKAAVANLSQSVAVYCGQQNYPIRCNWISPGFIDTPILDPIKDAEWLKNYIQSIPLGIMGTPEDIGNAALFLASDDSKYMTGSELRIDGGLISWTGMPWARETKK